MKVLVIGAAGKSGEALVNKALASGHKVTAFVRGAAYKKANVRVVAGDVLDPAAVDVAVAGQDAVIDALGGKTPWKVTTMETNAAHNIVDAMRRNGVRRLLKISVVDAGESVKNAGFFNEPCSCGRFCGACWSTRRAWRRRSRAAIWTGRLYGRRC
jgi:putative NADH-flavin reductase